MIKHTGPTGTAYFELEQGDLILEKKEVKELASYLSREFVPYDLIHAKTAVRRIVHMAHSVEHPVGTTEKTDVENNARSK